MYNKLFIFSFMSLFFLSNCLPSDNIWKQVKQIIGYKGDYNFINSFNYFIYQEKDYCKKNVDSDEWKKLSEKQKAFYYNRRNSNYIFVVENFDENSESIENGAFHLSQYLYNELGVGMQNSVFAIFSIQTRRITIRTGEITKKNITNSEASSIISSLGDLLRQNNYYEAFLKYYDELDYYMVEDNDNSLFIFFIVMGPIFFIIIFILTLIIVKQKCCPTIYLPNDSKLKDIVSFLKSQKANKKIFEENCCICLNSLINPKNKSEEKNSIEIMTDKKEINNKPLIEKMDDNNNLLIKIEDGNKNLVEKEEEGISTLNCGHQFHTDCIIKWLKTKNNCPICRQNILKESDYNKIIWNIQIELYPRYNYINYDHLYTKSFDIPSAHSSSYDYSSNYNFVGGADFGGGATGGW